IFRKLFEYVFWLRPYVALFRSIPTPRSPASPLSASPPSAPPSPSKGGRQLLPLMPPAPPSSPPSAFSPHAVESTRAASFGLTCMTRRCKGTGGWRNRRLTSGAWTGRRWAAIIGSEWGWLHRGRGWRAVEQQMREWGDMGKRLHSTTTNRTSDSTPGDNNNTGDINGASTTPPPLAYRGWVQGTPLAIRRSALLSMGSRLGFCFQRVLGQVQGGLSR
ncbi:hypothetical protein CLOM_g19164, partial [Closterium sp. NIES-68]